MAIDNVHTLARLDLKIIEALLDTHCSAGKKQWLACFETDKDGKGTFNLDAADVCFDRYSMPQELLTRIRIIHELGNKSGRDFVERMADKERFTLKRKAGRWNDQDFIGWLLAEDLDGSTCHFLEKVSFRKSTEKRTVYSQAVSQGKKKCDLTPLPLEKLEQMRIEYAERLFRKNRIRDAQKKAVRVLQYEEGGRLLLVIRYPGERNSHLGCTSAGEWQNFVFNPGCYDSVYLSQAGTGIALCMNVQQKEVETRRSIRMVLGEALFNDGNAFKQVDSVMTLEPLGKLPLSKLFNKNDENDQPITGLASLRIQSVKYIDRKLDMQDSAIITIEAEGWRDLRAGKRLRFLEPGVLGDDIEVQRIIVRYKIGMDSTDYMLELSERPEQKYPQKHTKVIGAWLKAKGFSKWSVESE
jgi:hypothetical protein